MGLTPDQIDAMRQRIGLPVPAKRDVDDLRNALQRMIYETTHLSPEEDDGSHWCKISAEALAQARAALSTPPAHVVDAVKREADNG